jgi:type III pantothenate kinase
LGSKCIKKINLKNISLHFPFIKFVETQFYVLNLIIDQGNTYIKIALFEDQKLIEKKIVNHWDSIIPYFDKVKSIILSSVKNDKIPAFLSTHPNFLFLDHTTKVPIVNKSRTPKTLGMDRLAAIIGASVKFPNSNVLVIDSGTCITYDILSVDNVYLGGSISPGLNMRFKSLHEQTSKLPLLNSDDSTPILVGDSTEKAIKSGVINGMLCEIDGIIERYKADYSDLKVILTGGDANFFDKDLKNSIFAAPDLVLTGLNELLKYNEANF